MDHLFFTMAMVTTLLNIKVEKRIEPEELPKRLATLLVSPAKNAYQFDLPVKKKGNTGGSTKKPVPFQEGKVGVPSRDPIRVNSPNLSGKDSGQGRGKRASGKSGQRGTKSSTVKAPPQRLAKRPSGKRSSLQVKTKDIGSTTSGNVDLFSGLKRDFQKLVGSASGNLGVKASRIKNLGGFDSEGKDGLALSGDGIGGGSSTPGLEGLAEESGPGIGRVGTGRGAIGKGEGLSAGRPKVVLRTGEGEEAIILGSLDPRLIKSAIESKKDQFRLCYEKEINAQSPDLAGSVLTSFVIGPTGRVVQSGLVSSTLKNANTERCILKVIRTIQFPRPKGGGIVEVKYPFKFRPIGTR